MAIRLPLATVLASDNSTEVGAGSTAGAVQIPFKLPQDTDNVVVKFMASTVGGAVSAVFQTSDDGGVTYYDVARTSIVSNANNNTAEWLSIPVVGAGMRSLSSFGSLVAVGSIVSFGSMTTTRNASSLTLGHSQYNGLPILGQQARIAIVITGDLTSSTVISTQVKVNSQSATA